MATENKLLESCIRDYYIYKGIWILFLGEMLICELEFGNIHDPYAVALTNPGTGTVGHIPLVPLLLLLLLLSDSLYILELACLATHPKGKDDPTHSLLGIFFFYKSLPLLRLSTSSFLYLFIQVRTVPSLIDQSEKSFRNA